MRAFYSIALFSILTLISLLIAHVLITKTNPKSVEKAEKYIPLQKPDLEKKKGYIDVCSLRKENMVAAILRYGSAAPTLCYNCYKNRDECLRWFLEFKSKFNGTILNTEDKCKSEKNYYYRLACYLINDVSPIKIYCKYIKEDVKLQILLGIILTCIR